MDEIYLSQVKFGNTISEKKIAYSIKEVADLIGVSIGHVRNEIRRGKLRSANSGRRILITDSDLWRYLEGKPVETKGVISCLCQR